MRSLARTAVLALLLITAAPFAGAPAAAHPFGPPLQVELEGLNYVVNLRWTAQEDDWLALARHVGAFEEVPRMLDGRELSGAQRIGRSEAVKDYLRERITVIQDDQPCASDVVDFSEDLVNQGVVLQFSCESQVYEVQLGIGVLTDVHESYRTVATAPAGGVPGTALYTAVDATHVWDFYAVTPPDDGLQARTVGLAASALLALLAAGVLLLGRVATDDRSPIFAGKEQV